VATQEPSSSGFGHALDTIVDGLRGNPPLLYGLGAGILLVGLVGAAGGIATDQLWLLVAALVVLILAGLGAWLIASRSQSSNRRRVKAGRDMIAEGKGSEILVTDGQPPADLDVSVKARRDVKASGGGRIGSVSSGPLESPNQDT
jgi:hypothetical protein